MVKVTINGEVFAFDNEHYALTEAIELEEGLGIPYGEYQRALARGSAKALAGFVWLVLKRDGRDTPLADILSGKFPLNDDDVTIEVEDEDPTDPPSAASAASTSEPSPSASESAPGSGETSPSPTSTT